MRRWYCYGKPGVGKHSVALVFMTSYRDSYNDVFVLVAGRVTVSCLLKPEIEISSDDDCRISLQTGWALPTET